MTEILSLISLICSEDHEDLNFQTTIAIKGLNYCMMALQLTHGLKRSYWISLQERDETVFCMLVLS